MANLSQKKREEMLRFLETLKEQHSDDESLMAINQIEKELTAKKYGLVWEEHEEEVDVKMQTHIPVFTEDKEKEIVGNPKSDEYNFLLEGDNLHSLKLLEKTHKGKIDVIYIDPPYNTKNKEFVYSDTCIGMDDGFRHSKWLSFMNKRLKLAKKLMTNDGLIFISIDDNELAPLIMLCNEIFGEDNFIDNIIWKKRYGGGAKEKYLVTLQEYILVYAKDLSNIDEITIPLPEEMIEKYYKMKDQNYGLRGGFRTHPLEANKTLDERANLQYPIPAPDGTLIYPKRQWLWSKDRVMKAIKNGEMYFTQNKDSTWNIQTKQYLKDEKGIIRRGKFQSIIDNIYTQHGTNEMIDFFGNAKKFSFPKPSELIVQILSLCEKKNATILDFFAGSGTTGQAVLKLNDKYDVNHHFILCTNNENKLCEEVTYRRLEKVINGYENRNSKFITGLPANLKYYKTDFIPKDSEELYDDLLDHIVEMIQLQYGVKVGNKKYVIIMDDDEMDEFEKNFQKYTELKALFINQDVLLTTSQEKLLSNVNTFIIPDCYFDFELREAGELW